MKFTQNYENKFTVNTETLGVYRISLNSKGEVKLFDYKNHLLDSNTLIPKEVKAKIKEIKKGNVFKNLKVRYDQLHKLAIIRSKQNIIN